MKQEAAVIAAAQNYVNCIRKLFATSAAFESARNTSDATVRLEATAAHLRANAEACQAELTLVKAVTLFEQLPEETQ